MSLTLASDELDDTVKKTGVTVEKAGRTLDHISAALDKIANSFERIANVIDYRTGDLYGILKWAKRFLIAATCAVPAGLGILLLAVLL